MLQAIDRGSSLPEQVATWSAQSPSTQSNTNSSTDNQQNTQSTATETQQQHTNNSNNTHVLPVLEQAHQTTSNLQPTASSTSLQQHDSNQVLTTTAEPTEVVHEEPDAHIGLIVHLFDTPRRVVSLNIVDFPQAIEHLFVKYRLEPTLLPFKHCQDVIAQVLADTNIQIVSNTVESADPIQRHQNLCKKQYGWLFSMITSICGSLNVYVFRVCCYSVCFIFT